MNTRIERKTVAQKNLENIPELPLPTLYWVRFGRLTFEDLTAVLDIYKEETGSYPISIEKERYEQLRIRVKNSGYDDLELDKGSFLEFRRRISPDGIKFVRLKIKRPGKDNLALQKRIDGYFLDQNKAFTTSQTID